MNNTNNETTRVTTGKETRFSYVNVYEPKSINGSAPKYSVSLIIPKTDTETVNKIKAAIRTAYRDGEGRLKGNGRTVQSLESLKTPLRDGDTERSGDEAYAGCWFLNATAQLQPKIFDVYKNEVTEPGFIYSGCYGRASLNFYAYNSNGNKGIACGLNGLQKIRDGEQLGGRGNVANDFDVEADDDDDDFLG